MNDRPAVVAAAVLDDERLRVGSREVEEQRAHPAPVAVVLAREEARARLQPREAAFDLRDREIEDGADADRVEGALSSRRHAQQDRGWLAERLVRREGGAGQEGPTRVTILRA